MFSIVIEIRMGQEMETVIVIELEMGIKIMIVDLDHDF